MRGGRKTARTVAPGKKAGTPRKKRAASPPAVPCAHCGFAAEAGCEVCAAPVCFSHYAFNLFGEIACLPRCTRPPLRPPDLSVARRLKPILEGVRLLDPDDD